MSILPSIRKHGGYLTQKRSMRCQVIHKTNTWSKRSKGKTQELEREKVASLSYVAFAKASKQALQTLISATAQKPYVAIYK